MADSAERDAELQERIRAGDLEAETELVRRFRTGIWQILLRWTGRPALAEELCQEALIIMIQRLRSHPLEDPQALPAFMAQTARNLAIAEKRRDRRRRTDVDSDSLGEVPDHSPDQEHSAQFDGAATAVAAVIGEIKSARDRHMLVRYYLREEDKEVICRDLGMTESNFNLVLFRARGRLMALLQKRGLGRADLFCLVVL